VTVSTAANPRAAEIMRDSIERNYQARLAGAPSGADTTPRAALLIAICAGVILDRMLLGHTELNSPDTKSSSPTCTPPSTPWRRRRSPLPVVSRNGVDGTPGSKGSADYLPAGSLTGWCRFLFTDGGRSRFPEALFHDREGFCTLCGTKPFAIMKDPCLASCQ
jgi:hypothetical protein